MAKPKVMHDKILWLDLEWAGLNVNDHPIVEVAAIVTDLELNEIARYEGPSVAGLSQFHMDLMAQWNIDQFTKNGLLEKIYQSKHPLSEIDHLFTQWVKGVFGSTQVVMAGNSIHNDRIWIKRWMPRLDGVLFYRQIDVTSFKLTLPTILGDKFVEYTGKKENHLALDDILESIDEFRHYTNLIKGQ